MLTKIEQKLLMGPGPSNVSQEVLAATALPTVGHLDPSFIDLMDETKQLLQYAFQTNNALTIPVSAPGSAGMEACFMNLLEPGDKVLVCENGVFGMRMAEVASRAQAQVVLLKQEWGEAVSPTLVKELLEKHDDIKVLAFVHAETSTGVRSDAQALCKLAMDYGCLTIVDTVTSIGGIELRVDDWGIDATYAGTQKCLSVPPGLSPVSFSDNALQKVANRKTKVMSWFLDVNQVMGYWGGGKRAYHHTAPVNAMYGLYAGLKHLKEETLEVAWKRHAQTHLQLKKGLAALGLEYAVDEAICLPQLNPILIPSGVDELLVRQTLLQDKKIEIGAGLGKFAGKVWRIGLMGETCKTENVKSLIAALGSVLNEQGFSCDTEAALKTF